jgi:WD40 repeat protein
VVCCYILFSGGGSGCHSSLITTAGDGSIRIWDARTWRMRTAFLGHDKPVYGARLWGGKLARIGLEEMGKWGGLGFSCNHTTEIFPTVAGREDVLMSWSSDCTVRLWDMLAYGEVVIVPSPQEGYDTIPKLPKS